jgi:translocator protein
MRIPNVLKLVLAVLVSGAAGLIGSLFTFEAIPTWYAGLVKPELVPPNWVFGPVWTTLYVLMGIAAFLVWRRVDVNDLLAKQKVNIALIVFGLQLVLNTLWSILFFGLQNPAAAFVDIVLLWLAIIATTVLFYRISKPAAWLLLLYFLWVTFASYLNFAIWKLN